MKKKKKNKVDRMDGWMENGESGKKTSYFLCFSIIETHTHNNMHFFCCWLLVHSFIHLGNSSSTPWNIFLHVAVHTVYIGLDFVENFFFKSKLPSRMKSLLIID